jgi:endonuclease/exonuclease/phosphatase family metal-dependent hydrolase
MPCPSHNRPPAPRRRFAWRQSVQRFEDSAYHKILEPIPDAPSFPTQDLRAPNGPRAATVGLYDHEQWPDGPFACDFVLVTEDLKPRISRCEVNRAGRSSDHQPPWLELH